MTLPIEALIPAEPRPAGDRPTSPATKRCPGCEEAKPFDAFFRNRARRDGRSTYCRACREFNVSSSSRSLLPTAPLLACLSAATGERGLRGIRDGEPGVHRLAARMQSMFGVEYENYRVQIDRILHGSLTRIHFTSADRLCMALGRHPAEVWRGEW